MKQWSVRSCSWIAFSEELIIVLIVRFAARSRFGRKPRKSLLSSWEASRSVISLTDMD